MAPVSVLAQAGQTDLSDLRDAELVALALDGSRSAKRMLFMRHVDLVHGMSFRLLGRLPEVDDLVQDTFTEALSSLPRLRDPSAFRAWVCAIAVRLARRRARRQKVLAKFHLAPSQAEGLEDAIAHNAPPDVRVEVSNVYRKLESVPERMRTAFILRRIEGLRLQEICDLMGASSASVKRWVKAAEDAVTSDEAEARER